MVEKSILVPSALNKWCSLVVDAHVSPIKCTPVFGTEDQTKSTLLLVKFKTYVGSLSMWFPFPSTILSGVTTKIPFYSNTMKFSEVQDIIPHPQSANVALNSPIIIVLKEDTKIEFNVETLFELTYPTTAQVLQQFPPVDKTETVRCEGLYTYNKDTRTVTFIPNSLLLPSTTYTIIFRNPNDLNNNNSSTSNWSFTTEKPLTSIRLLTQVYDSSTPKRMIVLSRQNNLFAELKAKISTKMKIQPTLINQMFVIIESEKHEIRSERDAYLLTEMNMVWVTLLDSEQSSLVVQLPTISYEEYVSMHWAPKWAGFYVIGCSKANEDEEAQIISALFNSMENKENV